MGDVHTSHNQVTKSQLPTDPINDNKTLREHYVLINEHLVNSVSSQEINSITTRFGNLENSLLILPGLASCAARPNKFYTRQEVFKFFSDRYFDNCAGLYLFMACEEKNIEVLSPLSRRFINIERSYSWKEREVNCLKSISEKYYTINSSLPEIKIIQGKIENSFVNDKNFLERKLYSENPRISPEVFSQLLFLFGIVSVFGHLSLRSEEAMNLNQLYFDNIKRFNLNQLLVSTSLATYMLKLFSEYRNSDSARIWQHVSFDLERRLKRDFFLTFDLSKLRDDVL